VSAIEAEVADVGLARLAHSQPVQAEQDCERGALVAELFGGEQEAAEFRAVHSVALARMHLRAAYVLRRVRRDPAVDVREPVQPAPVARRRSIVDAANPRCSM
jgi:hypothetical protein